MSCSYPGRERHKFNNQRICVFCNFSQGKIKKIETRTTPSGTEIKLDHMTDLFDAYAKARDELLNFLNQQRKQKLDLPCNIENYAREQINILYGELGREIYWGKHDDAVKNSQVETPPSKT